MILNFSLYLNLYKIIWLKFALLTFLLMKSEPVDRWNWKERVKQCERHRNNPQKQSQRILLQADLPWRDATSPLLHQVSASDQPFHDSLHRTINIKSIIQFLHNWNLYPPILDFSFFGLISHSTNSNVEFDLIELKYVLTDSTLMILKDKKQKSSNNKITHILH